MLGRFDVVESAVLFSECAALGQLHTDACIVGILESSRKSVLDASKNHEYGGVQHGQQIEDATEEGRIGSDPPSPPGYIYANPR